MALYMPASIRILNIRQDEVDVAISIDGEPAEPSKATLRVGQVLNVTLLAEHILEQIIKGGFQKSPPDFQ
jgi:hypothetical protein